MRKMLALISLGILLTGGFTDTGSQHYKLKTAARDHQQPSTGCPYLDGQSKCPYKNEINRNYILRQQDLSRQIKKV
jgi:hypothetical protein